MGMKLLVVDDDDNTASFIQYVLEDELYSVRTASAVGEAQRQLEEFAPDLIILDRSLPDKDGLEFCRELRRDKRFAGIPVLFLSAASDPTDITEGLNSGGNDYMTKPFDFLELVNRVKSLLKRPDQPLARA